jgi:hypothetical protein
VSCLESAQFVRRIDFGRRQRRRFVVHERRSGFQRRERAGQSTPSAALERLLIYLHENAGALLVVLVAANLLNLFDLVFTLRVLRLGATEGNPLMGQLLAAGPAQTAVMKLVLVGSVSLLIWCLRRYRLSLLAALFALGVYASIVLYECVAFIHLV